MTALMIVRGRGARFGGEEALFVRGTCIWHLMSSMGVRKRLVKAPLAAPQRMSGPSGSLISLRSFPLVVEGCSAPWRKVMARSCASR